jgi:hypothetical protein
MHAPRQSEQVVRIFLFLTAQRQSPDDLAMLAPDFAWTFPGQTSPQFNTHQH